MTEHDIDRRLGELLRRSDPEPDPAFTERVLLVARIDRQFARARRRSWRRAAIDCTAAAAVGLSFFFLSQTERPAAADMISLQGPAMAGLVMLLLWSLVALPIFSGQRSSAFAS
jgi:hypothetical protein